MIQEPQMRRVARAFRVLALLVNATGRRKMNLDLARRYRIVTPEPGSSARRAKMAPRALRRLKQGRDFIPVYGHAIPAPDHKLAIAAMKTKDTDIAMDYLMRTDAPKVVPLGKEEAGT